MNLFWKFYIWTVHFYTYIYKILIQSKTLIKILLVCKFKGVIDIFILFLLPAQAMCELYFANLQFKAISLLLAEESL